MAKLSNRLRDAIISEVTSRHVHVLRKQVPADVALGPIPPIPSPTELRALINAHPAYVHTTDRAKLETFNSVLFTLPELPSEGMVVPIDPPLPLVKKMPLTLNSEWRAQKSPTNQLQITAGPESIRGHVDRAISSGIATYRRTVYNDLGSLNTIKEVIQKFPEWAELSCIRKAIAHEKKLRERLKAAKKDAQPLEIIDASEQLSAIAKARLLGAKYVT